MNFWIKFNSHDTYLVADWLFSFGFFLKKKFGGHESFLWGH